MLEQGEKLWEFDAVEPGQEGRPTVVSIAAEGIAQYALLAQNPDPRYQRAGVSQEYGGALVAMPTMVLSYAPLLRDDIAEYNGFVALERSRTARRQTPFAKCEIRWFGPVQAGDTISATRRVLEKYERRGSRFVTFRVEAANQRGERVAEYDYTCIFEYARGKREVPRDRGTAQATLPSGRDDQSATPTVPARFLAFNSISVGDQLATLTISESQEIINRKNEFRLAGRPSASNIHTDEAFARQNIFGGTVNSGPATMSYLDQMLQRSFPLRAFHGGGRLLMRAIEPFRAGDTVTFQGEVTAKGVDPSIGAGSKPAPGATDYSPPTEAHPSLTKGGLPVGLVECRVKGINQRGDLVCLSDATLVLPE